MTASNHALTGALVAVAIPKTALALGAAFIAHFIMDALPHFGINEPDVFKRNRDKRFLYVLIYDVSLAVALIVLVPFALSPIVPVWISATCMFVCMSPDLVWGWRFYQELRTSRQAPKSLFSKFHTWIQWSESPRGAIVEVLWAILITSLLIKLT